MMTVGIPTLTAHFRTKFRMARLRSGRQHAHLNGNPTRTALPNMHSEEILVPPARVTQTRPRAPSAQDVVEIRSSQSRDHLELGARPSEMGPASPDGPSFRDSPERAPKGGLATHGLERSTLQRQRDLQPDALGVCAGGGRLGLHLRLSWSGLRYGRFFDKRRCSAQSAFRGNSRSASGHAAGCRNRPVLEEPGPTSEEIRSTSAESGPNSAKFGAEPQLPAAVVDRQEGICAL